MAGIEDPQVRAYRDALGAWERGGGKGARPQPPPQADSWLRYTEKELKSEGANTRDIRAGLSQGDVTPTTASGQSGSNFLLQLTAAQQGLDINNPADQQKLVSDWNNSAVANPSNGNPDQVYAEYDPAKRAAADSLRSKSAIVSPSTNWAMSDDWLQTQYGINDPFLANQTAATKAANMAGTQYANQNLGLANQNVGLANGYNAQLQGLGQQSYDNAAGYNQADQSTLGQYGNVLQQANNFDAGNYGQLQSALGQTRQLSAGGYGADVSSQAALARANPEDLARQNASYGALGNFANGGYNLTSAAAQAYADPNAIAAQYQSLGQMQGAANGSLNGVSQGAQAYADPWADQQFRSGIQQLGGAANGSLNTTSQAAQAYADAGTDQKYRAGLGDLYGVSQGSKDVRPGDLDPDAYAAQIDARNKYKDLTDPEVTAQERFIYEQARGQQEQDERNNRNAVLTQMRQSGRGGGASELAAAAIGGQQTSRNRLLSDLGAQSNAIDRSMTALQGYAGQSNVMGDQANQLGTANANRQTQALGQYVNEYGQLRSNTFNEAYQRGAATDQTNQANSNRQLQAMGLYTDQAGNLRAQTFDEAYKRGTAADTMQIANANRQLQAMGMSFDAAGNIREQSFNEAYQRGAATDQTNQFNVNTQFAGTQAQSDLATQMRNQGFNENFQTASAGDAMAQFNKEQSQVSQRWQEQYAAGQQTDAWNRQTDLTQQGNIYSSNVTGRANDFATTTLATNQNASQRNQQAIDSNATYGGLGYNAQTGAIAGLQNANTGAANAAQQAYQNTSANNALNISNNQYNTGLGINSFDKKAAANSADQGIILANNAQRAAAERAAANPDESDNDFDRWQQGK